MANLAGKKSSSSQGIRNLASGIRFPNGSPPIHSSSLTWTQWFHRIVHKLPDSEVIELALLHALLHYWNGLHKLCDRLKNKFRWELHPQKGYQEIKHSRHSCYVSLSRMSSQAKFLLMLSGYWQHACCYGYLRCLGSLVVQLVMCGTVLLAYTCRCNILRLKGDTMPFHTFWVIYTVKSWIVMRVRALSDPSESKSAPHNTFHSVIGSHRQRSSTCSRRMSLKMSFWMWGKNNLFSVMWTVDAICFTGAATEFHTGFVCSRHFGDECFITRYILTLDLHIVWY